MPDCSAQFKVDYDVHPKMPVIMGLQCMKTIERKKFC